MTRPDILQRLADALHANPPSCGTRGCATEGAVAALAALRALACEPGGAEAIAEAVGLRVIVFEYAGKERGTGTAPKEPTP